MIQEIIKIIILFGLDLHNSKGHSHFIAPDPIITPTVGEIWPKPKFIEKNDNYLFIDPNNFDFLVIAETCYILEKALKRYKKIIQLSVNSIVRNNEKKFMQSQLITKISVNLTKPCERYPHLNMDEWYFVAGAGRIQANSIWGMLRGLETFSQLITPGPNQLLQIRHVQIYDSPRFHYRGLLLDTSRHFISVNKILNILDGMVYNKLNVFHWHIVDDESFPYQSIKYPELSEKKAYMSSMIYTQENIANIIEYARIRGIRVIADFDIHVLCRYFKRYLSEIIKENNNENDDMDSSILFNDNIFNYLDNFYSEILDIFPDKFIHLGHYHEINLKNNSKTGNDNLHFLNNIFPRIITIIVQKGYTPILWQPELECLDVPLETIIQLTYRYLGLPNYVKYKESGYNVLTSDCWLLNDLYENWTNYYKCEQLKLNDPQIDKSLLIGGEALMWTHYANDNNVVQTIFPKLSAIAETLWSPEYRRNIYNQKLTQKRLEENICRLILRGVYAGPSAGPGYCG